MSNIIYINYGKAIFNMTTQLLEEINPQISKDARVVLKPNLVVAKKAEMGATTHIEIVEAVIEYLLKKGITNISVMEGAWIGENTNRAYKACGYHKLKVPFVDLKGDETQLFKIDGINIEFCKSILQADYLINLPVIKGHCQTKITCALKNMKGCISDNSKRMFHNLGLHKPIACLNKIKMADLVIADGICGDLDFEEGGNPVQSDMLVAGTDSVLIDSYVAKLMGYNPLDIEYIALASKYGLGKTEGEVLRVLSKEQPKPIANAGRKITSVEGYIKQDSACSACYASCVRALYNSPKKQTLHVGQGYKNIEAEGIGVGNCTCNFKSYVKGCPPTAIDIINHINKGH